MEGGKEESRPSITQALYQETGILTGEEGTQDSGCCQLKVMGGWMIRVELPVLGGGNKDDDSQAPLSWDWASS